MADDFPPFSAAARHSHLAALAGETWDLLVIGGGITGAAAARDAAGRGLRVALVDAGDVGRGTSSRSSRLIHGGLRYLETYDFRLVFEASAERRRLLELATHLVHPLPFLFPVYRGGPVGYRMLQAGMWLYDGLSLFRNIARHRMLPRARALDEEPNLRADGLVGAAVYYDAAVDDARITLANARGAHEAGAAVVPHAEVVGFLRDGKGIAGARVRDCLREGAQPVEVRARAVLNATGPWSDAVRRLADPGAVPRLRPTKGVHIMLRRDRVGNEHAITFRSPVDGRVMFVLPWGEFSYVGTTDTDYAGSPAEVRAEPEDVRYLLDSANFIFPSAKLTEADVVSTWAGIRPLLAPARGGDGGLAASATSREHEIWRDRGGLLNIAGGKLTTYRVMAAQVVDAAVRGLKEEHGVESGISPTEHLPLPGDPRGPWEPFRDRVVREAVDAGLGADTGEHLARAYGEDAEHVLSRVRGDDALAGRLMEGHPYVWAEVVHAVRAEMALTLEDVLVRRLHLFYEAADGGLAVAEAVARRMAAQPGIGWSDADVAVQVDGYRAAVRETRGFGGRAA
ncbi:glycerol-3-phosphate dehydrogenase/oxidase [Longimicrobium sp.]|uniref:glycerol-3-phosphate dehydrogenase/oxidase n=1 Tax=Longimicrobium sp. TaxID=2029185 RepID=UPI002E336C40|nr:glycerol-3-phosphate dehydrogenase/oxidase [Longimicrobium sp.]HEX6038606.1 glycerol-3-phosphate dehydrogenase/oxidase [Longimicrobium sp.]